MSEILDITSHISQKNKKFKNLFHGFLDTIQRYTWTKFQLPSFIFEEKICTCVILRKSLFCEKQRNFVQFCQNSHFFAFLPIKSSNLITTNQFILVKQVFEHLMSENRKILTKMTKFQLPSFIFEEKICTCVTLRKLPFCKKQPQFDKFC